MGVSSDPVGCDADKKIKGTKRHVLGDATGPTLRAVVHPADMQDRDGGALAVSCLLGRFPFLEKLFANGGYQEPPFAEAVSAALPAVTVEIVQKSDHAKGFPLLPGRWVVERTFAWLGRFRRLAKDFECLSRKALAFVYLASIRVMLRKLCNP